MKRCAGLDGSPCRGGLDGCLRAMAGDRRQRHDPDRRGRPDDRPICLLRRADEERRPRWRSPTSTPRAACSARSSSSISATTPAIRSRRSRSPTRWPARRGARRRAFLLRLVDPGLGGLCRSRHGADLAGLDQSRTSPTSAPAPDIFASAAATTSRAASPAHILAEHFADKNIAIVHDKSAYGKGLADETKKALNAAGKKEAMYEAITAGEKDYSALVSKLKQANIDVLYVGGYHTEAGLIMRQMRDQGMKTILIGGDALVTDEYWPITGRRRRRHADDLLARSAQEPGRGRGGQALQGQGHRARRLRALHLRRGPGLGAGGREGEVGRTRPRWSRRSTTPSSTR